ncbi:MAG: Glu/Leu/Phe/Val dehydrogenase dimerization domain-containing protein [Pseudomonadota bacterium]
MSIISSPYFDNHENFMVFTDVSVGLQAIIAIHNTFLGPAIGGTRFLHYQDEQEAIDDVLRLSKSMTYKAALANLPVGGGKAVILAGPQKNKSPALLKRYAIQLNTLQGNFITGEDVGIGPEEIKIMGQVSSFVKGLPEDGSGDPSSITAYGVFQGMQEAQKALLGTGNLLGKTVAIQGLGKVGLALARLLHNESVNVVACDIDDVRADMAKQELGIEIVDPKAIYDVSADIFAPCGLGNILNAKTIPRLRGRIVAGAANNQLESAEMGRLLQEQRILFAPDYVINAGGLIDVYYSGPCYNREQVLKKVDEIPQTLAQIFQKSHLFEEPTNRVADQMAQVRIAENVNTLGGDRERFNHFFSDNSS